MNNNKQRSEIEGEEGHHRGATRQPPLPSALFPAVARQVCLFSPSLHFNYHVLVAGVHEQCTHAYR